LKARDLLKFVDSLTDLITDGKKEDSLEIARGGMAFRI